MSVTAHRAAPTLGPLGFAAATLAYLSFHGAFAALVIFLGGWWPAISLCHDAEVPAAVAVAVNLLLILSFGVHHSLMARASVKRWLLRFVPEPLERASFVFGSSLLLAFVVYGWQPLPGVAWSVEAPALRALLWLAHAFGIGLIVASTFSFDHAQLFGIKQAWRALRGLPTTEPTLATPRLYRHVRHPMQLGVLIMLWTPPTLGSGPLLLALGLSAYVFVGLYFEERDLIARFGERYRRYARRVPRLLPRITAAPSEAE